MTRSPAWTPAENLALCRLYFTMLDKATAGQTYNKAELIRQAQGTGRGCLEPAPGINYPLQGRSRPSIEFKLMNASAAHAALEPEAVTMDGHGYRAMPNYQAELRDAMAAELGRRAGLALLPDSHPAQVRRA